MLRVWITGDRHQLVREDIIKVGGQSQVVLTSKFVVEPEANAHSKFESF